MQYRFNQEKSSVLPLFFRQPTPLQPRRALHHVVHLGVPHHVEGPGGTPSWGDRGGYTGPSAVDGELATLPPPPPAWSTGKTSIIFFCCHSTTNPPGGGSPGWLATRDLDKHTENSMRLLGITRTFHSKLCCPIKRLLSNGVRGKNKIKESDVCDGTPHA